MKDYYHRYQQVNRDSSSSSFSRSSDGLLILCGGIVTGN